MELIAYLQFNGQCEDAFKFYEKTFGGKIQSLSTFDQTPMADKIPPEWRKKVIHARMTIGNQTLMGSDPPGDHYHAPQGFSLSLMIPTALEAERIFAALSEGANIQMPLQETFWALRYGSLTDRFGTHWMVNCERPPQGV